MKISVWHALIAATLLAALFTPRLLNLDLFITADEPRWTTNTANFTRALAHSDLKGLYQQPHPGITTQWLGSLTVFSSNLATRHLPLALFQSLLVLAIGYIFWQLWGKKPALILTALLALNPLLIAHTRAYAMDSLLALFLLLSLGCLLLWSKTKTTRYLVFAAIAASLAVLSKLPGLVIVPFSIALITTTPPPPLSGGRGSTAARTATLWMAVFIATSFLVFPTLFVDLSGFVRSSYELVTEGHHADLHSAGPFYYLRTLIFFTTPLHLALLALIPLSWPKIKNKREIIILALFAALFIAMMSLSSKKGDRYILPSILILDVLVALAVAAIARSPLIRGARGVLVIVPIALIIQVFTLTQLHPYYLAYVNPITKPLFQDRRLGWGEGLNLAADYLNNQPNATNLKVASYYPTQFGYFFNGETIPLNHFNGNNADYAVFYRAMYERGESSWEQEILESFAQKNPVHVIRLGGLEYAWMYKI